MSDDEYIQFFRTVEEEMRRAGHGQAVDGALRRARQSLIDVLRAHRDRSRERQFIRGVLEEAYANDPVLRELKRKNTQR